MLTNKPIVAAIQGYAVAGGFELALWCDLRVVEETAVMGVFCRRCLALSLIPSVIKIGTSFQYICITRSIYNNTFALKMVGNIFSRRDGRLTHNFENYCHNTYRSFAGLYKIWHIWRSFSLSSICSPRSSILEEQIPAYAPRAPVYAVIFKRRQV